METNLTEAFFDRVGKGYEDAYGNDPPLRALVHKAAKQLPPNAAILDVGSGTGKPVADILASNGHHVHGIDRSQVMVDLSRKQVPTATFERVDMLGYAPSTKFNAIFAILVFFALSRPQYSELLEKFAKWLKPGGALYVGAIAADDYDADPELPIQKSQWDADGLFVTDVDHKFMGDVVQISMLTREGWRAAVEQAGFEIAQAYTEEFIPSMGYNYGKHGYRFIIAKRRE